MLRVAFLIHTAGQAHLWSAVARSLRQEGHATRMIARDTETVTALLDAFGEDYAVYGRLGSHWANKVMLLPEVGVRCIASARAFRPDIVVGTGVIEVSVASILGVPSVLLCDAEPTARLEGIAWRSMATSIVTPACFRGRLGTKHTLFNGYKELAYLAPQYFQADLSIKSELGLKEDEPYVLARFGAFQAVHDVCRTGLSKSERVQLVSQLSRHVRVFVSVEKASDAEFATYRLPVHFARIHHVLSSATLLVGDTGTMAWEAATLGTPAVVCGSFVQDFGNFDELEHRYGLVYCTEDAERALNQSLMIVKSDRYIWSERRRQLLNEKDDVQAFLVKHIVNVAHRS